MMLPMFAISEHPVMYIQVQIILYNPTLYTDSETIKVKGF